jgi:hypothetical protein
MNTPDKVAAILSLVPNAQIVVSGDNVQWINPSNPPVTDAQINTELNRLVQQHQANEYKRKRAQEYPDFRDYLDGVVKNDQDQIQAYIDACNAVKIKYPKTKS